MSNLESKEPSLISVHFTDGSEISVSGWNAAYVWLHLKNATDLLPLLYRSKGTYTDGKMTIPLSTLYDQQEEDYGEPITR